MPETFNFPTFTALTASDLAGKSREELGEYYQELNQNIGQIDRIYNNTIFRSKQFVVAYKAARKPLEVSSELLALAIWPYYVASTLEKQARVERERLVMAHSA